MNADDLYKLAEDPSGMHIEPCPVCGADATLWQYSTDFKNGPIHKVVMCSNGDRFGPQDGVINEGCLLYMPPPDFYRGRLVEAVSFWNEYANALGAQRRGRNWKRANVLRRATPAALFGREQAKGNDMHYRNGREANNGDKVVRLEGGVIVAFGTLQDATPGNDYCNGNIVHEGGHSTYACMCDCLHVDDVAEMLAEKGLDKRPDGK